MEQAVNKSTWRKIIEFPLTRIIVALVFLTVASLLVNMVAGALRNQGFQRIGLVADPLIVIVFPAAYFAYVKWVERRKVTELSKQNFLNDSWKGLLVSVILVAFVYGALMITGCLKITGSNPPSYMLVPFLGALRAGVMEELLIRGVLYRIIEEKLGTIISLIFTSILFGALHLVNPHATLMGAVSITLTAGLILGLAFTYTGKLWMSIALHFGWNFLTGGVFGTAVSGNEKMPSLFNCTLEGPEILTGGAFGPEASVFIIIAGLAVSAWLFVKIKQEGKVVKPFWKKN